MCGECLGSQEGCTVWDGRKESQAPPACSGTHKSGTCPLLFEISLNSVVVLFRGLISHLVNAYV